MNKDKIAKAIEKDAGREVTGLRNALAEMETSEIGRMTKPEQSIIIAARKSTGLSQSKFADIINTPLRTLQEWEQGRAAPPGVAVKLCELIIDKPEILEDVA